MLQAHVMTSDNKSAQVKTYTVSLSQQKHFSWGKSLTHHTFLLLSLNLMVEKHFVSSFFLA